MIAVNCKPKPFPNLYLVYWLIGTVKPKPKPKSKSVSKPKTKREKSLDSKSSPTDKPKRFTTVTETETLSKGGTPFLKRKKRVRSAVV